MPSFIHRPSMSVVVTQPGSPPPPECDVIDGETAERCGELLHHGLVLTQSQREALIYGNAQQFIDETITDELRAQLANVAATQEARRTSPALPVPGRWEYRVIPLTELFGLATAKGTAARMEEELNRLAADGWELVTTSERDSRWIGGETVVLIVRRYVVTEHLFEERFRAEERIRRRVISELDGTPPTEPAAR